MKSLRWILLILLPALLSATAPAIAQPAKSLPAPTGYIDDFAAVLTPAGKAELDSVCHEVHAKTHAQIFLVTVHSLGGDDIETYANDLFHQWRIGQKKTDRGVLVLLAIDDRKRRIEVGYGLEGILPDGKVGEIGRDMVSALQQANYDTAARIAVFQLADAIAADSNVTLVSTALTAAQLAETAPPPPPAAPSSNPAGTIVFGLMTLFFIVPIGLFLLLIVVNVRRARRRAASGYYNPGPTFIDTGNNYTPPASSSGSFFDTSGSSSSSSSSSSDSSFGDSSFSGGDGGDSGGGGASGDW